MGDSTKALFASSAANTATDSMEGTNRSSPYATTTTTTTKTLLAQRKQSSPMVAEGFERVFDLVGGHGIFQWRLLLIISFQLIILTWHHIGYTFLGSVPNHWCSIPELHQSTNWTLEQIKLISIPQVDLPPPQPSQSSTPTNTASNLQQQPPQPIHQFKKCEYFNIDYADLLQSSNYDFETAYSKLDWHNVSTKRCDVWEYDRSLYKSTVATEFNLVCENRWMAATIQGSYMAGALVGTLAAGSLSDKFLGRRKTVLISVGLVIVGGILASFATSYWMFLLLRIVVSVGVSGSMQNNFVLLTEHSDKKYRALLGIVGQVPFAIGYMMLPFLAYYFRDWDSLQLSFGLISIGLVVYYWILPESPRWLATQGQTDKAIGALYRIAKVNKLPRPNHLDLEEIVLQCSTNTTTTERRVKGDDDYDDGDKHVKTLSRCSRIIRILRKGVNGLANNFRSLMSAGEIRKRSFVFWGLFMIVAMVYYGIVFSGNLTSDPFLLVFLGGLMEVPAYTVVVPFVSKLGRRPTTSGTFILTGIFMLGLSWTPNEYEVIRISLAMGAKLFVSSGFAIIYLLGAELYPTELRTTGLAVGIFMGRVGAISAPYIVDMMQNVYRDLPTVIFGTIAVVAGFVSLLLPETKTLEMSDKVIEIEMIAEEEKVKERERKMSWVVGL